jgi:hypothetical protein
MFTPPREAVETRLYRAALSLCPPAFRREFGSQMLRDLADACRDADLVGGPSGVWAFRARISLDVARTLVTQWWRTGLPVIAVLAMTATFIAISSLDRVWRHMQVQLPIANPDFEGLAVLMLAAVLLVFITLTILLTQWATHPRLRRHVPHRRR